MIIGHKKQWNFLKSMALSGDLPHAFLFSGQNHLGKKKIAFELAKFLFCQNPSKPCNNCRICKSIESNSHPDFILLESSEISSVRDLIWKLSLRPYSAPLKIAVIDNCHLMNQEAQNCMLKTLEEPKPSVLIIMITSHSEIMLPTILSRVQTIRFFPVSSKEIGLGEKIYSLCSGLPGKAVELSKDNGKIKEQEKIIESFKTINSSDFASRFSYAKKAAEEDPADVLSLWIGYFRNILINALSGKVDAKHSVLKIKKIISNLQTIHYLLSTTNVNPRLAMEMAMMEI